MLTTLENLKTYLGDPKDQDVLLTRLAEAASSYFETLTGRKFAAAEYAETQVGTGTDVIIPKHYPVNEVSALTINGEPIGASIDGRSGHYLVDSVIHLRGYRAAPGALVAVTYTAGYQTIPADVEQAVIEIAALRHKSRTLKSGEDSGSFIPVFQLPASIQTVVEAYRRRDI
jgi:hypothetical protein